MSDRQCVAAIGLPLSHSMSEKKRRSSHQTQWAAQFAVASELCKKGYEVALMMGNRPTADIMVYSPGGKAFVIDVKGQYKRNWWVVREKPEREDAFYVFALVPDVGANRFFILTQAEVNKGIRDSSMPCGLARSLRGFRLTRRKRSHASRSDLPSLSKIDGISYPIDVSASAFFCISTVSSHPQ